MGLPKTPTTEEEHFPVKIIAKYPTELLKNKIFLEDKLCTALE